MSKEVVKISPEGLEIANAYAVFGNINAVCQEVGCDRNTVAEVLERREVKQYIDTLWLDAGYRNRANLGSLLDEMIESKLEEARETEQYTQKDLIELMAMSHKMRMDELKMQLEREKLEIARDKATNVKNQTNVQINNNAAPDVLPFGQGNYGKLMEALVGGKVVEPGEV